MKIKNQGLKGQKISINVKKMYMNVQFFWSEDVTVHWEHLYSKLLHSNYMYLKKYTRWTSSYVLL